jgi:tRNA pseudouridine38-40 synthase
MPRFALLIEYDGRTFHGWQRQAGGAPSVQARLEDAIARVAPEAPAVTGAGRTDAGVHATGQVAHVDLARDWDGFRLTEALNAHLRPDPVAVLAAARVGDGFHARFDAIGRRYAFTLLNRRAPPALERGQVWHVAHPLDPGAMQAAAAHLIGRHDFSTFRAALCQAKSPVKTLDRIDISARPCPGGQRLTLTFEARSFLHSQVRSLVGTLERVGAGAWPPERVAKALAARDRAACGPVAPPDGLVLAAVSYPADPFLSPPS